MVRIVNGEIVRDDTPTKRNNTFSGNNQSSLSHQANSAVHGSNTSETRPGHPQNYNRNTETNDNVKVIEVAFLDTLAEKLGIRGKTVLIPAGMLY